MTESKRGGEAVKWRASGVKAEMIERAANGGYTLVEIDEIASDVTKWAVCHGKVRDLVTRDPVPFIPRTLQRRLWSHYQHCKAEQCPFRVVMCKVRRGGGSTGMEAILYVHAHNYNARLGAVGTDDSVSKNMFDFINTFDLYDDFPGWPNKAVKRLEGEGYLKWANGSSWEKYSAESPEAARSAGLQGYHASECGRWASTGAKDASETLKSMLGAVPKRGFTVAGEESTAQGAAGAFYKRFMGGRWPSARELGVNEGEEYWRKWESETPQNLIEVGGDLQFVRVFAAWFEDDENRMEVMTEAQAQFIERTLDEKERKLIERYGSYGPQGQRLGDVVEQATVWQQLAWRRSVIESEFEGDVEGYEQEYPSSPKEAFASSGRHSFNVAGCAWMTTLSKSSHSELGILSEQSDGRVVFTRTDESEAWLELFEQPKAGHRYIVGLDTMEGEEQASGHKQNDYHAGVGLRAAFIDGDGHKQPHKTAAALRPKSVVEADVLAKQIDLLSRWYGRCLVVPEINRTGYGYLAYAKQLGTNLFHREKIDRFSSELTGIVGWETTDKTRPQLIAAMQVAIRNNAKEETRCDGLECTSRTVASECATMVKNAKGKDEAAPGCHDDHVMATGMALCNISGATYYSGEIRRRRGPADRRNWKRLH